ncbi:MAG TPA: hypothetical protein VFV93_02910, partial [Thermomicrobiales bacterium]|nr:hypothetical protein [Thermomicrobiales bacterium]
MSSLVTADARPALAVSVASCLVFAMAGLTGSSPLALLALIVAVALACVSPVGAIAAAVASLPYFYCPLDIGGQHVAASELLLFAALLGTGFRVLVAAAESPSGALRNVQRQLGPVLRSPLAIAAAGLVVLGGLLVLMPYDPTHRAESLREWRWTLLEPALLLGLLIWHRRDPLLRELVAVALIAGGTVASLHALGDYALGGGVTVAGVTRIAGPYPHPNALALMTVRIAALAFVWAVVDRRVRRWILPLLVICAVTVAATFSRGAMLAGLVAVAIVLV